MDQKKMNTYAEAKVDGSFAKMLDRGIDDMEAGRELPLKDAFRKVEELRSTEWWKRSGGRIS